MPDPKPASPSPRVIYNNRIFSGLLYMLGKGFLGISGWKLVNTPPNIEKYVAIAAPHTSNWDFPIFLSVVGLLRMKVSFLGKHTLFKGYFGRLFFWLGGIPVDRGTEAASEIVDQVIKVFDQNDHMILGIAPEGTRSRVKKWKTGFYRIALGAGVPIVPAYLDSSNKTLGFGPTFIPSGDMEADLLTLQEYYADKKAINPVNH